MEASDKMTADVFEKTERRSAPPHDSGDIWPEVALVFAAKPLACGRKWLAWVPSNDAIHFATPRSRVEGAQVRPDRRRSQGFFLHRADQCCGGESFPLHISDGVSPSEPQPGTGEVEPEVEPSDPGAQTDGT